MTQEFDATKNYESGEKVRVDNIRDYLIYSINPTMTTLIAPAISPPSSDHEELGRSIGTLICETYGNPPDRILIAAIYGRVYERAIDTQTEFGTYEQFIQQHGGNH